MEYYRELEASKNSYEARKNFYIKKNKILEQVDDNFENSLLQKQGTFYNNFKQYKSQTQREKEVVIGSKDLLSENPDLFKYEKFEDEIINKVSMKIVDRKNAKTVNLNEFKEIHSMRFKSFNNLAFITPFQNQVLLKKKQKKELDEKLKEIKNRNQGLQNMLSAKNLNKAFAAQLHNARLDFTNKNFIAPNNGNNLNNPNYYNYNNGFNDLNNLNLLQKEKDRKKTLSINYEFDRNNSLFIYDFNAERKHNLFKIIENKEENINDQSKAKILQCIYAKLPGKEKIDLLLRRKKENSKEKSLENEPLSYQNTRKDESFNLNNLINEGKINYEMELPKIRNSEDNSKMTNANTVAIESAISLPKSIMNKNLKSDKDKEKRYNLELSNHQFKYLIPNSNHSLDRKNLTQDSPKTIVLKSRLTADKKNLEGDYSNSNNINQISLNNSNLVSTERNNNNNNSINNVIINENNNISSKKINSNFCDSRKKKISSSNYFNLYETTKTLNSLNLDNTNIKNVNSSPRRTKKEIVMSQDYRLALDKIANNNGTEDYEEISRENSQALGSFSNRESSKQKVNNLKSKNSRNFVKENDLLKASQCSSIDLDSYNNTFMIKPRYKKEENKACEESDTNYFDKQIGKTLNSNNRLLFNKQSFKKIENQKINKSLNEKFLQGVKKNIIVLNYNKDDILKNNKQYHKSTSSLVNNENQPFRENSKDHKNETPFISRANNNSPLNNQTLRSLNLNNILPNKNINDQSFISLQKINNSSKNSGNNTAVNKYKNPNICTNSSGSVFLTYYKITEVKTENIKEETETQINSYNKENNETNNDNSNNSTNHKKKDSEIPNRKKYNTIYKIEARNEMKLTNKLKNYKISDKENSEKKNKGNNFMNLNLSKSNINTNTNNNINNNVESNGINLNIVNININDINYSKQNVPTNTHNNNSHYNNSNAGNKSIDEIFVNPESKIDSSRDSFSNCNNSKVLTEGIGILKSKNVDFNSRISSNTNTLKMMKKNFLNKEMNKANSNLDKIIETKNTSEATQVFTPNDLNKEQNFITSPIIIDFSGFNKASPRHLKENTIEGNITTSNANNLININGNSYNYTSATNNIHSGFVNNEKIRIASSKKKKENLATEKSNRNTSFNIYSKKADNKEKNIYKDFKVKEHTEYFLNRNIFEEYKNINLISKNTSESQLIHSELKYKIEGLHEQNINSAKYNNDLVTGFDINNNYQSFTKNNPKKLNTKEVTLPKI